MREIVAHPPIPGDNGCWRLWNPDTGEYAESEFPLPEGADGYSPTANVIQNDNGATITITDKNGTTTATVKNGKDGADGIKTAVIEGVIDETTLQMVYTPNMTYEEAHDMMLNFEPFNVIWIEGRPSYEAQWISVKKVRCDIENNRISLSLSDGRTCYWSAAGIVPKPR